MESGLIQLDARPFAPSVGHHLAFMVVRNELQRLPYCLTYHRALGIERFFIVDNGSNDGTREFLLTQPDCHVFYTEDSFSQANYGMAWINRLVETYGIDSWCLFVDADELFVYPHSERVTLPALCRFLDQQGSEGVFSLLLDMYSDKPIAEAVYESGTPFLFTTPHFDRDYQFRRRLGLSRSQEPLLNIEVLGGPRLRKFYPEFRDAPPWKQNLWRALRRIRRHRVGEALGMKRLHWGSAIAPEQSKIPLIKGRPGLSWASNHRCTERRLSEITGALLHFKFFSDFHHRARTEAARAQHWDNGAEYVRYAALLNVDAAASLFIPGCETYHSTEQLIELGLIRTSIELDALAGCRTKLPSEQPLREQALRLESATRHALELKSAGSDVRGPA